MVSQFTPLKVSILKAELKTVSLAIMTAAVADEA